MEKNIIRYMLLAVMTMAFSSCLKDDAFDENKTGLRAGKDESVLVELPYQSHSITHALNLVDQEISLDLFNVNVAESGGLKQAVTATLDTIGAYKAIHDYNEENETEYEKLPDAMYSMSSFNVSIPAGNNKAPFTIKLNPTNLDPAVTYALEYKLSKIDNAGYPISGNFDYVMVVIGVKNKYDGVYTVTGSYQDLNFPAYSGYYPKEIELRTVNANTVLYFDDHDLGDAGYVFNTGAALSSYGNWAPQFVFDTNTDIVSAVTNYYGQGTNSSLRSGKIDPTGVNKYDASAKTIDVKYIMVQGGSDRIKVSEKFEFKSER